MFLIIAILVPVSVNAYLQNATQSLPVTVQTNQGTVRVDDNGASLAVLPGDPPQEMPSGASVLTDGTAAGSLSVLLPEDEALLARLQIYSNTAVRLAQATTPQFGLSEQPNRFDLSLTNGRLRLVVPEAEERPLVANISTPHGEVVVEEPGQYSFDVSNQVTQVTVQEGEADITAVGEMLTLQDAQRARIVLDSPPEGPFAPQRDLIRNGDFGNGADDWVQYAWNVEREPVGSVNIVDVAGEPGLQVIRDGQGHADVGIRQVINKDVTDYALLELEVNLRILGQTLAVCGSVGSECPIIIRVEYDDEDGNSQVWQQGFYAVGFSGQEGTPDVCVTCPQPLFAHARVPLAQFSVFRANLIEDVQQKGFLPPRFIKNVSVFASGHSFNVEILEVALHAEETIAE